MQKELDMELVEIDCTRTGSGKTRIMIQVLDNFYLDARAKIPIFPSPTVCQNFYMELLRWPNKYRDYFCSTCPEDAALASGTPDWQSQKLAKWKFQQLIGMQSMRLCQSLKTVLDNMFDEEWCSSAECAGTGQSA